MPNRSQIFHLDKSSPLTLWINLLIKAPRLLSKAMKGDSAAHALLSEPARLQALVRTERWILADDLERKRLRCRRGWTREDETRVLIDNQLARGFRPPTRVDRLVERVQKIQDIRLRAAINEARVDGTLKVLSQILHDSDTELQSLLELAKTRECDSSKVTLRAYLNSRARLEDLVSEIFKWAKLPQASVRMGDANTTLGIGINEHKRAKRAMPTNHEVIESIERKTPKLDTESVEWLAARKKNEKKLGMQIDTLRNYRAPSKGGRKMPDNMFGIDRDGRRWRRQGTPKSMVYYFAPTLPKR